MTTGTVVSLEFAGTCVLGSGLYMQKNQSLDAGTWWVIPPSQVKCFNGTSGVYAVTNLYSTPPGNEISLTDSATLISGVLLVWSLAWVFRQVRGQISNRR